MIVNKEEKNGKVYMSLEKTKPTDYMRTVMDYPEPGVNFYDINSLFAQPAWNQVAAELSVAVQTKYGEYEVEECLCVMQKFYERHGIEVEDDDQEDNR